MLQVQDGNVVIGSSHTLIEGLTTEARVTRADSDGLVLGFELQDGPKSMADIVLGKVYPLHRRHSCPLIPSEIWCSSISRTGLP